MRCNKYISVILLLLLSHLAFCGTYILEKKDIDNIAARDIHDILSKVYSLRGFSYGTVGQPVYFSGTDRSSSEVSLYVDDVRYGMSVKDLSFIQTDRIERIVVEDISSECAGIEIRMYTKEYDTAVPVSEVNYKDAFFNYRDLSVSLAQNISPGFSVSVYGEIMDFKDNREYSDNFKYPYLKQNYGFKTLLPDMFGYIPVLNVSYLTEKKYLLDSDSSLSRPELLRSVLYFDRKISGSISNRIGGISISEGMKKNGRVTVFDELRIADTSYSFTAETGFSSGNKESASGFIKASYSGEQIASHEFRGFFRLNEGSETAVSVYALLSKNIASFTFFSKNGYFEKSTGGGSYGFFDNSLTAEKKTGTGISALTVRAGIDLISENDRKYYRAGFATGEGSALTFRSDIIASGCRIKDNDIKSNLVSSLSFSEKYFNEKLSLNFGIFHHYSEYFIESRKETLNNLSFNIRARIVNFEFFFGSDNFLKKSYKAGNTRFDLNDHYVYRTIEGYDMRTHDEIWGVKWTFYR